MTDTLDTLLAAVVSYGPPVFALTIFLASVGIPIPTTMVVVACGAFVQQGMIDWQVALLLGLVGAVSGDGVSYGLGSWVRKPVERWFAHSGSWHKAEDVFNRRGGMAVFLTRFLLTALALPVNLIAGESSFSFGRFIVLSAVGQLIWLGTYGGLGYLFGTEWEAISDLLSDFTGLILGLFILGAGIYFLIRWMRRSQKRS